MLQPCSEYGLTSLEHGVTTALPTSDPNFGLSKSTWGPNIAWRARRRDLRLKNEVRSSILGSRRRNHAVAAASRSPNSLKTGRKGTRMIKKHQKMSENQANRHLQLVKMKKFRPRPVASAGARQCLTSSQPSRPRTPPTFGRRC